MNEKRWKSTGIQAGAVVLVLLAMYYDFYSVFKEDIADKIKEAGENVGEWHAQAVVLSVLAAVLVSVVLCRVSRNSKLALVNLVLLAMMVLFGKNIVRGFTIIAKAVIGRYNVYYDKSYDYDNKYFSRLDVILAFVMLAAVVSIILTLIIKLNKMLAAGIVIALLPVIVCAVCGQLPGVAGTVFLIASLVFYCTACKNPDESLRTYAMPVCIVLVISIVGTMFVSVIDSYKEKNRQEYDRIKSEIREMQNSIDFRTIIDDIKYELIARFQKGGIGGGDLSNLDYRVIKGVTDLEVTVDKKPQKPIYLKGFVADKYTDKRWISSDAGELYEYMEEELSNQEEKKIYEYMYNEVYDMVREHDFEYAEETEINDSHVTVKLKNADSKYCYAPYYSKDTRDLRTNLGMYLMGDGSSEYGYDVIDYDYANNILMDVDGEDYYYYGKLAYQRVESERYGNDGVLVYESEDDNNTADDARLMNEYIDGMYDKCRYDEKSEVVTNFCDSLSEFRDVNDYIISDYFYTDRIDALRERISKLFDTQFMYSLRPGSVPDGRGWLEYFLNDGKKGFCVHFASAAVLIFRNYNIPARYVEGYMVPPSAFERQEDGTYKALVTDGMAHSWAEVLDKYCGWQVYEATPGYDSTQALDAKDVEKQQETNTVAASSQVASTEARTEEMTDSSVTTAQNVPTDGNKGQQNKSGQDGKGGNSDGGSEGSKVSTGRDAMNKIMFVAMIVFLAVAGVIFQARARLHCKFKKFGDKTNNMGISRMYNHILEMCGHVYSECNMGKDDSDWKKAMEKFKQPDKEEWVWMHECACRAAFSNAIMENGDYRRMEQNLRKIRNKILNEQKGISKFMFVYVKAL